MNLIYVVMLFVFGLIFGSFTNALVWRLHEKSKSKSKRALTDDRLSIVRGRSVCPHCTHVLSPLDLVPVVSWVWLKGHCRYCHKAIPDTPLPELLLPAAFVVSYIAWPFGFEVSGFTYFGVWLAVLTAFAALIAYDIRWMLLPNKIIYPMLIFTALHVVIQALLAESLASEVLFRAVIAAAIGGGLFYLLFHISDGKWIGGGDVKLGFVLGFLLLRPEFAMLMLFTASLIGVVYSLPLMATKKLQASSRVPFGPFLMLATAIVLLWGGDLISWYSSAANSIFLP